MNADELRAAFSLRIGPTGEWSMRGRPRGLSARRGAGQARPQCACRGWTGQCWHGDQGVRRRLQRPAAPSSLSGRQDLATAWRNQARAGTSASAGCRIDDGIVARSRSPTSSAPIVSPQAGVPGRRPPDRCRASAA